MAVSQTLGSVLQVNLLIPISYLMFWVVLLGFSLYSDPVVCGLGMVIMLTGVPVYIVGVWWKDKPKWISRAVGKLTSHTPHPHPHPRLHRRLCAELSCAMLQKRSHMLARRCVTWCFLRKTLQSRNPSTPPKPTEQLSPPQPPHHPRQCAFCGSLFGFFSFFFTDFVLTTLSVCDFFNLVRELMCLMMCVSLYYNRVITSKYASDLCISYFCC